MNSLPFITPLKSLRLAALAAALTCLGAHAAWHDGRHGDGVSAHYVRLTGYGGDNEVNRKNLAAGHQACVATLTAFGKKPAPLPPQGLPEIVSSQQIEIYYAANRTLTVKQGTLHVVDQDTCAIADVPHRLLEIRSAAGRCDIDLIKKEARGVCDANAHRLAPAGIDNRSSARMPAVDRNKVPPEMRAQLDAQLARLAELQRARAGNAAEGLPGTGQQKRLADMSCEIRRGASQPDELCIAALTPTSGRPLNPFPIPAASLNAGIPGLLLEAKTPALTLQAQEVRLNLSVADELFAMPADVKLKPASGRMP